MENVSIDDKDFEELKESAGILIDNLVSNDPLSYASPDFHENIESETKRLLTIQTLDLVPEDIIDTAIAESFSIFYSHIWPRRECSNTFIRKPPNIEKMQKQLEHLRSIPQPEQRTSEWYEFRHNYITASSAWKAFSSQSQKNQLIYDKCCPHDPTKYQSTGNLDSPLQWGVRYEPISIMWYELVYNTKIDDFGCLPHSSIQCLAASPDGINIDANSMRFGRMLEVKNIVNREINGKPKLEYWIQMQLQMEVCELNECDFLETRFKEYENHDDFIQDGTFERTNEDKIKGTIIQFADNNVPVYEYAPLDITEDKYNKWEISIMEKNNSLTWIRNIHWYLDEISCILVLRNKFWFSVAKPVIEDIWKVIEEERVNGYEHRGPKKRKVSNHLSSTIKTPQCHINTEALINPNKPIASTKVPVITIDTECL